ncbi:catalase [Vagococcus fluvialis]|uniref:catalase n=1 Tax=Vagococcus fluvialis TaxID=2738 RepID=UPI003B5A3CF8
MTDYLTTNQGTPVKDDINSLTAGSRGPILIQDTHLLEKLAHFNRERVPERVVHAKGAGAYGEFVVTNDVSKFTKAKFLSEVGKKTEMFARFSTVAGELGSADTLRDPRGFALKFYTEEGNFDFVGNNTPVFFVRDPLKFPDFIHTQKRNPQTHLKDPNAVWDFWSLSPESLHQVTILMSDRGIPATFRHMHGYGSHTYMWTNEEGVPHWIKYHFRTNQGIKCLDVKVAEELAGTNPEYHTEDLFNAIEAGDFPSWTLSVQVIPYEDGLKYGSDIFDVTKTVSQKDYPLQEVGVFTLNRNPENYFNEVEQATFSPGNFVPGIEASPDKLLQGRLFAYGDAHRYRVGSNSHHLPVNAPKNGIRNHQQDGSMSYAKVTSSVNYSPNSFDQLDEAKQHQDYAQEIRETVGNFGYNQDFYSHAGILYNLFTDDEKDRLTSNIVAGLKNVSRVDIIERQLKHFYLADKDYGERIEMKLKELKVL